MRKGLVLMLLLAIVVMAVVGVGAALAKPNCDNPKVAEHNKNCGSACPLPVQIPKEIREPLCAALAMLQPPG